ncbi:thiopurine S-methyltransferase (TPMT) [Sphingobacterium spiritivorum ATCC 33300]|uniref:Thiopurine S-methyltransferase (TPMT) n=2 Tax=Sphingobacteriaceae TaxID=84566 RepID=C2FRW0_SPHSI|nr:methyltransferase domain-containing protein [Sphingobacterium spiritivorum]EEI94325.1 thiopurine S-methyltransferase (TPMT) [Sphingobacterium spiritivorum ATCC 33300]QQS98078.1 methyltransferase domain-containing protein [Sphingobacterium spiritivorum]
MSKKEKDVQCCLTQCENPLDQNYWDERWLKNETGWDMGQASPAITKYMEQYPNKNAAILIPGCGNAYEAEYLLVKGFMNITLIDIAPKAVETLKEKFSGTPQVKVLCGDFFGHEGNYDLIIEQTFFCAIPPGRRKEYAEKTASLLNENGKIIGVLFDKQFNQSFPPFGGCPCEYKPIFEPHFTIKTMDGCYNSIPSRTKSEVFINLIKKQKR